MTLRTYWGTGHLGPERKSTSVIKFREDKRGFLLLTEPNPMDVI